MAIVSVPTFITDENVAELIHDGDLLMLCCDNHPTRKLISDYCEKLSDIVLISGEMKRLILPGSWEPTAMFKSRSDAPGRI